MSDFEVRIDVTDAEAIIEAELLKSLHAQQAQGVNRSFNLVAENADGGMIGGLTASTSYGWLLIKILWVDSDSRRLGIGGSLLNRAEQLGTEYGCQAAWLDTSSADARRFYLRYGYHDFGVLSNRPGQPLPHHRRWFMQKQLTN